METGESKVFLEKADLFAGNIDIQSIKKPLPDALDQRIVWITYPPGGNFDL